MLVNMHLFPTHDFSHYLCSSRREQERIFHRFRFLRGLDPKVRPVTYLPSISPAASVCASAERFAAGSRFPGPSPTGAPPGSHQPDSSGMGSTGGGDLRGRRGRDSRRRVGPFPQSQAGGVARAQVKLTPTYPGNFRGRDSLGEARVAQGRPGRRPERRPLPPGLRAATQRGVSPPGTCGPLGALGAASRASLRG